MTIQTNLNDRKGLARRLIPFNHNEKLRYTGTPAFTYEGRGFRILRSSDIECDDEKTEAAITDFLQEAGILPQPKPEEGTETEVTQEPTQQDETPESEALPGKNSVSFFLLLFFHSWKNSPPYAQYTPALCYFTFCYISAL